MRVIPYGLAIGSIMYAMLCTRLDVSYALSAMSRYQSHYGNTHYTIVKNILKYLRRTKEPFLVFGGEEQLIVMDLVFCLHGGAVSWKRAKQDTVADSTMEAEYIAASEVVVFGSEILFLSWVLFLVLPVLRISIMTIV
jgi:hypothetical protein